MPDDPMALVHDRLRERGLDPKVNGDGYTSRCPAHQDGRPSLTISRGEKGIVLHCHAGCTFRQIVQSLGLKAAQLFYEQAPRRRPPKAKPSGSPPPDRWAQASARFRAQLIPARLAELAETLGTVPGLEDGLRALGVGWASQDDLAALSKGGKARSGGYTFPMFDGAGRTCGINVRPPSGTKWTVGGGKLGLFVPARLAEMPDPVLVPEGASDTAFAIATGRTAVGRPSANFGAELLAELLRGRELILLAENDRKRDGRWPGLEGAKAVQAKLASLTGRRPRVLVPPEGVKDLREHLTRTAAGGGA